MNAEPTELLDLNDDCLILVASQLSLHDLNSFASSCARLQDVARSTFVLNPTNKHLVIKGCDAIAYEEFKIVVQRILNNPNVYCEISKEICGKKLADFNARMRRYLINFGGLIESLHFQSYIMIAEQYSDEILCNYALFDEVLAFCSPGTLKRITLDGFTWTPGHTSRALPIFGHLEIVTFRNCYNLIGILEECIEFNLEQIIAGCVNATALEIDFNHRNWIDDKFDEVILPKMTKLKLLDSFVYVLDTSIETFIMNNLQIEDIEICPMQNFNLSILNRMPQLRRAKFKFRKRLEPIEDDRNGGLDFGKLQHLEIDCFADGTDAVWTFLIALTKSKATHSLETLKINENLRLDDVNINYIARFESLRKLDLPDCITNLNFIQNLHYLTELSVSCTEWTALEPNAFQLLEKLDIFNVNVDDQFVRNLTKLCYLRELTLVPAAINVTDQGWPQLQNVSRLIKLKIYVKNCMRPDFFTKWLTNLGSTHTLTKLILNNRVNIDDKFLLALCRFTELKMLDLWANGRPQCSLEILQTMNKLSRIYLLDKENSGFAEDFLMNVACTSTLTQISLRYCVGNRWLQRFERLQSLELYYLTEIDLVNVNRFLPYLRELHFEQMLFRWNDLLTFIAGAVELQKISFGHNIFRQVSLPREIFARIAGIYHHRDTVLTIVTYVEINENVFENVQHRQFVRIIVNKNFSNYDEREA